MVFEKAKWIWENKDDNINEYINFLDFFIADELYKKVEMKISVDSNYELYINGCFVNFGQYADYPFYKVYDTLDITEYIIEGKNTIALLGYYHGVDASTYYKNKPGIIFEVMANEKVLIGSSENTLCRKAVDYKSGNIEEITGQIGFAYHYDKRNYDGWNESGYNALEIWHYAFLVAFSDKLFERPIKKLVLEECAKGFIVSQGVFINDINESETTAYKMQHSYMAYRSLFGLSGVSTRQCLPFSDGCSFFCEDGDGIFIVADLEKEVAGGLVLDIDAPEGTLVEIGFGEHLDDLRVRTFIGGRNFALSYICKEGKNSFTNYLRRLGCRYIQLHVHSKSFTLYNLGIIPQVYPLIMKGNNIKDKLHKKIYETCAETLRLCMHEHYEDTPWREQALYSMDSRNQMLCGYYAFEGFDFAKASLKLMLLSKKEDNQLSLCSPAKHPLTIPCFSLVWFLQLYEYVVYSGDVDFAKDVYVEAAEILSSFLCRVDENGLILEYEEEGFWNFYEWTEGLDGYNELNKNRYSSILNAFLSIAVYSFSKIADLLGNKEDRDKYSALQDKINKAIDTYFWDENSHAYATFMKDNQISHFAQLTQALIIYAGACPKQKLFGLLEKLAHEKDILNEISLSHSIFKYDVLMQNDPLKYADYVADDIGEIWGKMLFQNATSFWETSSGGWSFNNAGSLSHGWSAGPLYIYSKYKIV